MSKPKSPQIVIVGAGPAGMTLAYLLVTNGVAVRVLERHPDFKREFRGELIQPVVLGHLQQLGILQLLVGRGLAIPEVERRLFAGETRVVAVPGGGERGALISQPGFLELLHELCSRHPHYRLERGTAALSAIREEGKMVALTARTGSAELRVDGDVFVVCNGRGSPLRKDAGLEVEQFQIPADALWLRFDFSDAVELLPKGVDVHMYGKGVVAVFFPTSGSRLQVAYSAPGDLSALRKDLPELRKRVLPTVPLAMREKVAAQLDEQTESQVLKVAVDHLKQWHVPGMLFLGDAAHTMSPAGGQGLNLAIRDAIVASNCILDAITGGAEVDDAVFRKIEAERRPEIEKIQAMQTRVSRMVMPPLAAQHLIFTLLGLVMKVKKLGGAQGAEVEIRYPVTALEMPAAALS